jgi:preprotein translocase subunit SecG
MQAVLLVLHVFLGVGMIGLILIQHGKGADVGAAFGSGASGTIFGARGSASFLSRATAALATVFFINSMTLAYLSTRTTEPTSVIERVGVTAPPAPVEAPPPLETPPSTPDDVPQLPAGRD